MDARRIEEKLRIKVPAGPGMQIFSPDGWFAYVCSSFDPETEVITVADRKIVGHVPQASPFCPNIAATPDVRLGETGSDTDERHASQSLMTGGFATEEHMASEAIRDPAQDHLLTPQNSALLIIDYQPVQVTSVASMDRREMVTNIVAVAKVAKLYGVPVVLSTVNVTSGRNQPTIHQLQEVLGDVPSYDRTTINAWEDVEFVGAVKATGRKKLIMTALWTEACLTFPTLDALRDGYAVYPVVDAVGGTSLVAHHAALERMSQAGAKLTGWVQLICELQRDWARVKTAPKFAEILFAVEGH